MCTSGERKHWWLRVPCSWGVDVVLVLALLAGAAFGIAQVRGRDATIADQAAGISERDVTIADQAAGITQQAVTMADLVAAFNEQAVTLQQAREQVQAQRRVAELDGTIIEAYGVLQAQRVAMERAQRGESGERYEAAAVAAAVAQTQSRLETLLAQRRAWQVRSSSRRRGIQRGTAAWPVEMRRRAALTRPNSGRSCRRAGRAGTARWWRCWRGRASAGPAPRWRRDRARGWRGRGAASAG